MGFLLHSATAVMQLFQSHQEQSPTPLLRGGIFSATRAIGGGGRAFSISTRTQFCFPLRRRRRPLFFGVKSVPQSSSIVDGLQNSRVVPSNVLKAEKEQKRHISEASPTKLPLNSKKLKALARMTEIGTDGQLHPNTLYLLDIGWDMNHIKQMAIKYPQITSPGWGRRVRPFVEFLLDLGMPPSDIPNILYKTPSLCNCSLSENLLPSMAYLETFGLDKSKWAKVIKRFPHLLKYSKHKVKATVDFLYELGVSRDRIGKVLTVNPEIVGLSIDDNLRPTAEYFRSMGVNLASLFGNTPRVFCRSITRQLEPVTGFLLDKGYSIDDVGLMASRYGSLYTLSLTKNLIPKWDFFLTMDYPRSELVKCPHYFGYSLEGRIKPRYALMMECDVKVPMSRLLTPSDSDLHKILNRRKKKKTVLDGHL